MRGRLGAEKVPQRQSRASRVRDPPHLDPVVLPEGTRLTVSPSIWPPRTCVPASRPWPVLRTRWQPPWDHGHICWPDFGLPTDATLLPGRSCVSKAGPWGSTRGGMSRRSGRTGTVLSCLAALSGHPARELSHGYGLATALKRPRHASRKPSSLPSSAPETVRIRAPAGAGGRPHP